MALERRSSYDIGHSGGNDASAVGTTPRGPATQWVNARGTTSEGASHGRGDRSADDHGLEQAGAGNDRDVTAKQAHRAVRN